MSTAENLKMPLSLVSLHREDQFNFLGKPHTCFADLSQFVLPQVVIIAAGEQCYKGLLVDPRVHLLLQKVVKNRGKIAIASGSELYLGRVPFELRIPPRQIVFQRGKSPAEFVKEIFVT